MADKTVPRNCWRNFWLLRKYLEIPLRLYETYFQGNIENVLQILNELKYSEEFFLLSLLLAEYEVVNPRKYKLKREQIFSRLYETRLFLF